MTFLSKILERIIANQLLVYLYVTGLLPSSGFRRNHSTETLLVRLLSDFYGAMDCGQITLLALFDVSASFDSILLNRLSVSFGLIGKPLEWLRSFLTDYFAVLLLVPLGPSGSLPYLVYHRDRFWALYFTFCTRRILAP